jgi:EAL and modified HD-GYP domain-containing signal transduction protein
MKTSHDQAERPPDSSAPNDIFVARQSIYDVNLHVIGYEVLFRGSRENRAMVVDGNQATSELLMNAVIDIGLKRIVGEKIAFINFTRGFLLGDLPLPLAPARLVLEILEDVRIDEELVAGLARLVEQGYTFALDDAVFRDELIPLLRLSCIVKVELPAIPRHELEDHVRHFRNYPVVLLAEKVETLEEFNRCRLLGFQYFQGFFLSRPQMIPGKKQCASDIAVLQVLGKLSAPNVSVSELEQIIKNDAALSYKLLRYINSARFALYTRIESLRQVILLLGVQGIRTMAMLAALAGTTHKPGDVLRDATQRAMLCEKLARLLSDLDPSACFTAGLISSLDAVFDLPVFDILESLPLSDALKRAVLRHEGSVGEVLHCAIAIERAEWDAITCRGLTPAQIRAAYLSAIDEVAVLWASLTS